MLTPDEPASVAPSGLDLRRCAVWGSPIAHSLSPVLHRAAYAALGLPDWAYDRRDVDTEAFGPALDELGEAWRGLSLTMPLKELALARAVEASDAALATGGANTLVRQVDGWHAHNTDVYGIRTALSDALPTGARPESALVIGSGATARSAVAALAGSGLRAVTFMVRGSVRSQALAQAEHAGLVVDAVPMGSWGRCDVVVSTVPPAAVTGLETFPSADRAGSGVVIDVVYGSGVTPLQRASRALGWRQAGGLDVLLHQATEQVRLMTGRDAPVEAMRTALDEAVGSGLGSSHVHPDSTTTGS